MTIGKPGLWWRDIVENEDSAAASNCQLEARQIESVWSRRGSIQVGPLGWDARRFRVVGVVNRSKTLEGERAFSQQDWAS